MDANGDFVLEGGCIKVDEADGQTIENILRANRGAFKEAPLVGGETTKMLGGTPSSLWCAQVKKQIQSVGVPVTRVETDGTQIIVKQ